MNYGIENGVLREPARVLMHLPESWTKVVFIRVRGIDWDIPTIKIPENLREIGSIFLLESRVPGVWHENSEERYKRRFDDLIVTALPASEVEKYHNLHIRF